MSESEGSGTTGIGTEGMGSDSSPPHSGEGRSSLIDRIVILLLAALIFGISVRYQLFDAVYSEIGENEEFQFEELFIVLAILPLTFMVYAHRRKKELLREQEEGRRKDEIAVQGRKLNRIILDTMSEAIVIFDGSGQIVHVNRYAENILGIYRNESDGNLYLRGDLEFLRSDGTRMLPQDWVVSRVMMEARPVMDKKLGIVNSDGTISWFIVNAVPSVTQQGGVDRVVVTMNDVTDLIRAEEEKSKAMTTNAVLEAMGDGLVLLNMEGKIITVNNAFEKMTGYPREELVGMYGANLISNLIKLDKGKTAMDGIKETIEDESRPYGAIILQTRNGVEIPTAITASYLRDDQGNPQAIITTFKNIANVLMLEDALRESNERFQRITAYANDAIFLVDDLGRISYWNPASEKIFGYSKVEAEGKKLTHLILPRQFREELSERMNKPPIADNEPFIRKTVESMAKRKDGEEFPIELSFSILIIKGSFHTIGIVRDISERKRAEQALLESEEMQKALFEGSTDPILVIDLEDRIIKANPAFQRVFGYSNEELIGRRFPGGEGIDNGKLAEWIEICRTGSGVSDYETIRRNRIGEPITVSMSISPILDSSGNLISLSLWYRDITQRKRTEEQLRFQVHLLNSVRESVVATDLDGKITYWGRGAEDLYNYSADEVLGELITRVIGPLGAPEDAGRIQDTIDTGSWSGELLQRRKDDSVFRASTSMSLVDDVKGNPAGIISIDRDISVLRDTEEALKASEERYRAVTETVFAGIVIVDQQNRLIYVNTSFADMVDYTKDELLGMDLFELTDRTDFEAYLNIQAAEVEDQPNYESIAYRKDGSVLNVLVASADLPSKDRLFAGTLYAFIDITDRIEAEERIRTSLEEKEVLLKEVHHRVKNNLQVVSSLLYLQSEKLSDNYGRSMLRESQNRVKSMALVHERLYQSEDLARINFADYIRNLGAHLFHSYGLDPGKVSMNLDIEEIYLSIEIAIPCGLIINELVSNALKHAFPMERAGEITIHFSKDREMTYTLIISDNGIGLPDDIELASTESMGLHLVNTLTRQLDATLTVERTDGTLYEIQFKEP